MRKGFTAFAAALSAAALAIATASSAWASDEVRVKMDPLNWNWTGTIYLHPLSQTTRNEIDTDVDYGSATFSVKPGDGPQQVMNFELGSGGDFPDSEIALVTRGVVFGDEVVDPEKDAFITQEKRVRIKSLRIFGMDAETMQLSLDTDPPSAWEVDVDYSFTRSYDESQDKTFYELKFFPTKNAPAISAEKNLHEVQSEGVDDCDVARTLEPGDTLTTGDGADTVCVTLDGDGDAPIEVETGDGNDVVLIEGETDSPVVVDTGRGDDTVVTDTDANVDVATGEGSDAVVDGGNAEVTDGSAGDVVVSVASAPNDCERTVFVFGGTRCLDD